MASQAQYDAAYKADMTIVQNAIQTEVGDNPFIKVEVSKYMSKIEQYVMQMSKAAVDAAEGVK